MMLDNIDDEATRIKKSGLDRTLSQKNQHGEPVNEVKTQLRTKYEEENVREIIEKYHREMIEKKIVKSKRL